MLDICSAILWLAPEPTATMAITAPTPIMIPSMVSAERILFTRRARSDILNVEGILITVCLPVHRSRYVHPENGWSFLHKLQCQVRGSR